MARNVEENVYVTIGFARASPIWQRLQHEARELDISVPHLIKALLADRAAALEGHSKHLWFPREMQPTLTQTAQEKPPFVSELAVEDDTSRRSTTAAAAANYWED